jgi:hypothetical protein
MPRRRSPQSLQQTIAKQIAKRGRGTVFTPRRFVRFGNRAAIDKAFSRLTAAGTIRRLGRGFYDYPRIHPKLGPLAPTIDATAKAIAGRDKIRLQPSGAYAANMLRLSEQVPAKVQFLTEGKTRRVRLGGREIVLKGTSPRNLAAAARTTGLVIQGLRYIGKKNVNPTRIKHLRSMLSERDRKRLIRDLRLAPTWMHPHLRFIAGEPSRQ